MLDELVTIVEAIKGYSPVALLLILIVVVIFRWFASKDKETEAQAEKHLAQQIDTAVSNTVALQAVVSKSVEGQKNMIGVLSSLSEANDIRFAQEVSVLQQIHRQLVTLNAVTASAVSPANAKVIIEQNWNWCRDETARVITGSIRNNHFKGNEERVARSVYKALLKACTDSMAGITKIEGIKYPYHHLFTHHIKLIWEMLWDWSLPVYHGSHDAQLDASLKDLTERIVAIFDQVLILHIEIVEDIDSGLYYDETQSTRQTAIASDLTIPAKMAHKLIEFTPDTGATSGIRLRLTTDYIKQRLIGNFQEDLAKQEFKPYQRTKSSAEIRVQ